MVVGRVSVHFNCHGIKSVIFKIFFGVFMLVKPDTFGSCRNPFDRKIRTRIIICLTSPHNIYKDYLFLPLITTTCLYIFFSWICYKRALAVYIQWILGFLLGGEGQRGVFQWLKRRGSRDSTRGLTDETHQTTNLTDGMSLTINLSITEHRNKRNKIKTKILEKNSTFLKTYKNNKLILLFHTKKSQTENRTKQK